ncbi:unnamed protein product, partial [Laminaria digitata]
MGVQEVMHLLLQSSSVMHNLEFIRASTQCTDVEVVADGTRRLAVKRDLLPAYAARRDDDAWCRGKPEESQLAAMPYSEFAATFKLNRGGQILRHSRRNRVVSLGPFLSCKPRGERYADYCRNSLVKFRPWSGGLHDGWGGTE